jgi:carbon storage regulator CsrA
MLILYRKIGEGAVFDGPGRVVVLSVRGCTVRLGFEADRAVAIHRDEVAAEIEKKRGEEGRP